MVSLMLNTVMDVINQCLMSILPDTTVYIFFMYQYYSAFFIMSKPFCFLVILKHHLMKCGKDALNLTSFSWLLSFVLLW
jgi:hypothetical protein